MITKSDIKNMNITKSKKGYFSNNITKKLSQKKFSLQFLPECLEHIKDVKYIEYKGKNLKTSYLFDIVNNLILKYYFKKENRFPLNATVLKDRYGYLYNYYINYLVDNNILSMVMNYKTGVTSRIYSLNEVIFKSKIKRYKNQDSVLLKKYKKKIFDTIEFSEESGKSLIENEVKEKLISDLFNIQIDLSRSIFFLDSLKDKDLDIYNRNLYSVDCINNKHIFYHFDSYGRMHTNFTILRSFIRKNCLLIDGEETCEIDISNSQPLFLTKLIKDSNTNWVKDEEFQIFKELTTTGKYYQYMMQVLNIKSKSDVKELTYKVLFGRNSANTKADKSFKKVFPTIHNFITLYKKEYGDYKILAYDLQKAESELIFNRIIRKMMDTNPNIKVITVHDSIIVAKKWKETANAIFETELLNEFNF
jgi:hypothetical protein